VINKPDQEGASESDGGHGQEGDDNQHGEQVDAPDE
jgi:hypothetical protein